MLFYVSTSYSSELYVITISLWFEMHRISMCANLGELVFARALRSASPLATCQYIMLCLDKDYSQTLAFRAILPLGTFSGISKMSLLLI